MARILSSYLLPFECVPGFHNRCHNIRFGGRSFDSQRVPGSAGLGGFNARNNFHGTNDSSFTVTAMHAFNGIDGRIGIGLLMGEIPPSFTNTALSKKT